MERVKAVKQYLYSSALSLEQFNRIMNRTQKQLDVIEGRAEPNEKICCTLPEVKVRKNGRRLTAWDELPDKKKCIVCKREFGPEVLPEHHHVPSWWKVRKVCSDECLRKWRSITMIRVQREKKEKKK